MSSVTTWDPFAEMGTIRDELDRLMGQALRASPARPWAPAMDVFDTEEAIVVKGDLPGVRAEDVSIEYDDGVLTIRGERKLEERVDRDRFHRIERHYGVLERSFRLPTGADAEHITATFKDGVLEVTVPKSADAKPRRVEIAAG